MEADADIGDDEAEIWEAEVREEKASQASSARDRARSRVELAEAHAITEEESLATWQKSFYHSNTHRGEEGVTDVSAAIERGKRAWKRPTDGRWRG